MHISKVENSAEVSSCSLKFVHDPNFLLFAAVLKSCNLVM
jgi:hypothetical protein